jgi:hypothetical protein
MKASSMQFNKALTTPSSIRNSMFESNVSSGFSNAVLVDKKPHCCQQHLKPHCCQQHLNPIAASLGIIKHLPACL